METGGHIDYNSTTIDNKMAYLSTRHKLFVRCHELQQLLYVISWMCVVSGTSAGCYVNALVLL